MTLSASQPTFFCLPQNRRHPGSLMESDTVLLSWTVTIFLGFFFFLNFFFFKSLPLCLVNLWHRGCCWGESWQKSHFRPPTIHSCIILYIHLPPFSPYALSLKVCFYSSHFLYIQILRRTTIVLPPLPVILPLATLSSSSYYLFVLTWSYTFFSPQPSPSPFLIFFLWT